MAFEIFRLSGRIDYQGSEQVVSGLRRTKREFTSAERQLVTFGNVARRVGTRVGTVFRRLGRAAFSLQGALVGVGLSLGVKTFIDAASASEQFRVRLRQLLGDVEEANKLFASMEELASLVPFQYREIMESATALSGVMRDGREEIEGWMPIILDLAAASGLTVEETTSQIIKMYSAGAAAADMFRERGILAMLGFQAGVSYTAEETRDRKSKPGRTSTRSSEARPTLWPRPGRASSR